MKISCIDSSASGRLHLQQILEEALASGRDSIGYVPIASFECRSPREVVLGAIPDVAIVGPEMPDEHALELIAELRAKRSSIPVTILRSPEKVTVRLLRRFDLLSIPVITLSEPPARLLHLLIGYSQNHRSKLSSRIVLVAGAKGGVGTSTLTAALAHSAMEIGRRALVVDLSRYSSLLHDLGAQRLHSTDYTALLTATGVPDSSVLERLVVVAPNGIECLLPPSGGTETRERWLRDPSALEQSINLIELFMQQYDVVLVDHGHAEGLLGYALAARADSLLFVTSNDPASVYRTIHLSRELEDLPRSPRTFIALTLLCSNGLTAADAASFLGSQLASSGTTRPELFTVPLDRRAAGWVGTGNTFFTEGASDTKRRLVGMVKQLIHVSDVTGSSGILEHRKSTPGSSSPEHGPADPQRGGALVMLDRRWRLLPFRGSESGSRVSKRREKDLQGESTLPLSPRRIHYLEPDTKVLEPLPAETKSHAETTVTADRLEYTPPKPYRPLVQSGALPNTKPRIQGPGCIQGTTVRGVIALEQLLFLSATVLLGMILLGVLQNRVNDLGIRISDEPTQSEESVP